MNGFLFDDQQAVEVRPTDAFDAFWEQYPRKTAKKAAERAWRRLKASPATVRTILADIAKRRTSEAWTKQGGSFIPYPATYLNGERWNDEPEAEKAGFFSGLRAFVEGGQ